MNDETQAKESQGENDCFSTSKYEVVTQDDGKHKDDLKNLVPCWLQGVRLNELEIVDKFIQQFH